MELPPFIFSFRVKLPWIFFSSASMVSPPMSASRCVRFTMPMPNTMSVTCCGSALTKLRRLPPAPSGLLGVAGSLCSFSKITLQSGSEGRWPASAGKHVRREISYPKTPASKSFLYIRYRDGLTHFLFSSLNFNYFFLLGFELWLFLWIYWQILLILFYFLSLLLCVFISVWHFGQKCRFKKAYSFFFTN